MTPEACRVKIDGWRLAVVLRGRKWTRVWTFGGRRPRRYAAGALVTQPVDRSTAERLLALFDQEEARLKSVL